MHWWSLAALAAPPLDAVVLVEQGASVCAGAFIDDDGTVATAYHCVAAGGRPRVEARDGTQTIGRVVGVDRRHDLALLSTGPFPPPQVLPLRPMPPAIGAEVWALGHPMGAKIPGGFLAGTLRWSASQGVVSAVGPHAVQVTAPVNPGNSGGPLVDAEGSLVGVVSRRLKGDGLGFAARADALQALVDAEDRRLSPLGGTLGAELIGTSLGGLDGTLSLGARAEVSLRDHLVFSALGAVPYRARWDAMRFGELRWLESEASVALRQRVFRGVGTLRADLFVARTGVGLAAPDPDGGVDLRRTGGYTVGGSLDMPGLGLGLELAATRLPDGDVTRGGLVYTWPGTFWMF